ncbi:hypothetical protein Tco_1144764 [Tanacetum coccineum]
MDSPIQLDDGDDENSDLSRDDANDEDEDEDEEEHLAPADSAVVVPTDEPISLPEGTKLTEVERLLAMTTPSPTPPISLSPPFVGECLARCMAVPAHSSPPPVPSPLLPLSGCPTQIQTLRITSTQALIDAVTVVLPSPPLPPLPPSLYIPPPVDRRDDSPESEQPPRKRLCLSTLGSRYETGESSTVRPSIEAVPEIALDGDRGRGTSDIATTAGYSHSDTASHQRLSMCDENIARDGDMQTELLELAGQR